MASNKKELFIQYMVNSPTITQAAEKAGITRQTASRYMKDERVQKGINEARAKIMEDAKNFLSGHLLNSSMVLVSIIADKKTSAAVRIQAINSLFSILAKLEDQSEIIERLVILERRINS